MHTNLPVNELVDMHLDELEEIKELLTQSNQGPNTDSQTSPPKTKRGKMEPPPPNTTLSSSPSSSEMLACNVGGQCTNKSMAHQWEQPAQWNSHRTPAPGMN